MPNPKITGNIAGPAIRNARRGTDMTQADLSAALRVDFQIDLAPDIISRIESGERTIRDIELVAIAKALNTSPHKLLGWKKAE